MLRATYCQYNLRFQQPAITSRETMLEKETYFIKIWEDTNPNIYGIGECALFRGLSADDVPDYEDVLANVCRNINNIEQLNLINYSSIVFGLETAMLDLKNGGNRCVFPSWHKSNKGIVINGLVWMGTFEEMYERIKNKIGDGFKCIKLKIGGIDFNREIELIKYIRSKFSAETLEIRLDANGAFTSKEALNKLNELSLYSIHSIEQPIKSGQWLEMANICKTSPIPIALDEELIGINSQTNKKQLLETIKPQYIILKPALCGGFSGADEWIELAKMYSVDWWATSALESNIGLNAIAQWVATHNISLPQGLGTGQLYKNNIKSPLEMMGDMIYYNNASQWEIPKLDWEKL